MFNVINASLCNFSIPILKKITIKITDSKSNKQWGKGAHKCLRNF